MKQYVRKAASEGKGASKYETMKLQCNALRCILGPQSAFDELDKELSAMGIHPPSIDTPFPPLVCSLPPTMLSACAFRNHESKSLQEVRSAPCSQCRQREQQATKSTSRRHFSRG